MRMVQMVKTGTRNSDFQEFPPIWPAFLSQSLGPCFLKVSVDQFSQNLYISIINQQSSIVNEMVSGVDISSFSEKARCLKDTSVKYGRSQLFDSPALDRAKGRGLTLSTASLPRPARRGLVPPNGSRITIRPQSTAVFC